MAQSYVCYKCKERFPAAEMIGYKEHRFCPACYNKARENEVFSNFICELFGLISPGPRIWAEKARLEKKGCSTKTMMRTLDYVYNIKREPKPQKLHETIYLVNPENIAEAKEYYKRKEEEQKMAIEAAKVKKEKIYIVPIKENTTNNSKIIDLDALLDEE